MSQGNVNQHDKSMTSIDDKLISSVNDILMPWVNDIYFLFDDVIM